MTQQLFREHDLRETLKSIKESIVKEINSLPESKLSLISVEARRRRTLVTKYIIDVPIIKKNNITVDYGDSEEGTYFIFRIPFSGNSEMFNNCPSSPIITSAILPDEKLSSGCVDVAYNLPRKELKDLHKNFAHYLELMQEHLNRIQNEVNVFNDSLEQYVIDKIDERMEKLRYDKEIIDNIPYRCVKN